MGIETIYFHFCCCCCVNEKIQSLISSARRSALSPQHIARLPNIDGQEEVAEKESAAYELQSHCKDDFLPTYSLV